MSSIATVAPLAAAPVEQKRWSSYEDYQLERIVPVIERLSWFALPVLLAFLPWDYASDSHWRSLAVVFRVLSIVPVALIGFAARYRWFDKEFVTGVLLLSLCSFGLLNMNFLLLEERSPYLFSILFYFNLGFLMLAPLVSNVHIVANFVIPVALVYTTYAAFGRLDRYLLPFTLHGLPVLVFLNVCVWYARRLAHHSFTLDRLNQELATTDSLTQINNRRVWEQQSRLLLSKAKREGTNFALLLLDIDFFKRINDTYGHPAGDITLRRLADCLRSLVREYDVLGRFGGDEFALTISDLNQEQVLALAERLRLLMAAQSIEFGEVRLRITLSIGVAMLGVDDIELEALVARSDVALYKAKQNGRNQVYLWQPQLL